MLTKSGAPMGQDDVRFDADLDRELANSFRDQQAVDDAVSAVMKASRRYRGRGLPGEVMSTRAIVAVVLSTHRRRRWHRLAQLSVRG